MYNVQYKHVCTADKSHLQNQRGVQWSLAHKKRNFLKQHIWNTLTDVSLHYQKKPIPWAKMKIDFEKKKSWRIWVDHHNWINMLQKLQATSTSFLSWQLSFGILQTKHKWFDCNMWNIWPSYPWQSICCRGDLITVVKFITASLIQGTNKKTQELLPQNQRWY